MAFKELLRLGNGVLAVVDPGLTAIVTPMVLRVAELAVWRGGRGVAGSEAICASSRVWPVGLAAFEGRFMVGGLRLGG
jgi:hypothetical protein